ncbi:MAG: hypothetical protein HYY84_18270 [Deltaproteobacteria bacterium]|nr:hypothetical protein [Deltaproteobacteria bacterium]
MLVAVGTANARGTTTWPPSASDIPDCAAPPITDRVPTLYERVAMARTR